MTRRCGRLTWANRGVGEANEASARPANTSPLPTSITPIIRRSRPAGRRCPMRWPSTTPSSASPTNMVNRCQCRPSDRRPSDANPSRAMPPEMARATGAVARTACMSSNRRVSQAMSGGPDVPNMTSITPTTVPTAAECQGAPAECPVPCGAAALALTAPPITRPPAQATYRPSAKSGHCDCKKCVNRVPSTTPAIMPGTSCTSSRQRTSAKFNRPCKAEAITSMLTTSGTTSASGHCQASRGTAINAEPKPLTPSTP
jgi:hypothetical protein